LEKFLIMGLVLGLSAGFAPGPLTTLIITESLQHGTKAGLKVSLAPFVTDFPIILFSLFFLATLAEFQHILGAISILGSCLILYMGISNLRLKPVVVQNENKTSRSFFKGIFVHSLSPNPYLFWLTVGGPILHGATSFSAAEFLFCFYGTLVGIKMGMAILVGRSRHFLSGKAYIWIMRFLGIVLCFLAMILLKDGLKLIGLLTG
jgi:threonine/homoserine/homoserine lactone efflux protein